MFMMIGKRIMNQFLTMFIDYTLTILKWVVDEPWYTELRIMTKKNGEMMFSGLILVIMNTTKHN